MVEGKGKKREKNRNIGARHRTNIEARQRPPPGTQARSGQDSFHRDDSLCSSILDQDDEKKHVVRALKRNDYPRGVMSCSETRSNRQAQSDDGPPNATVVLPYIRNTSESIRRVLSTVNIRTCFKPYKTLSQSLVHVKDPVPQDCRKGVVYKVPCNSCDMSYVGETGRTLHLRLKEHKRALTNGDPWMSALAEHAMNHQHALLGRMQQL